MDQRWYQRPGVLELWWLRFIDRQTLPAVPLGRAFPLSNPLPRDNVVLR
jgi:hypothetical protein